jgi:hypothetical protein
MQQQFEGGRGGNNSCHFLKSDSASASYAKKANFKNYFKSA